MSEQLQSLKTQIATLRRAIQKKRAEHMQSAAEHERLAGEIEASMDWLAEKEAEVKTRPLLDPSAEDVERRLSEHDRLASEVEPVLDKIRRLRDKAKSEGGDCDVNLPASVANILSAAAAMLGSMPQELADRRTYLEENKNHRLKYDGLVERLNKMVAGRKPEPTPGLLRILAACAEPAAAEVVQRVERMGEVFTARYNQGGESSAASFAGRRAARASSRFSFRTFFQARCRPLLDTSQPATSSVGSRTSLEV